MTDKLFLIADKSTRVIATWFDEKNIRDETLAFFNRSASHPDRYIPAEMTIAAPGVWIIYPTGLIVSESAAKGIRLAEKRLLRQIAGPTCPNSPTTPNTPAAEVNQ